MSFVKIRQAHHSEISSVQSLDAMMLEDGFRPISSTYDPDWKHAIDKPVDGCIVWLKYLDR